MIYLVLLENQMHFRLQSRSGYTTETTQVYVAWTEFSTRLSGL